MLGTRKFIQDESGQVAVIFGLSLIPLLGLMSAAVDYSKFTKERISISSALDAAVLAAANNNAIPNADKHSYAKTHFEENYAGGVDLTLVAAVETGRVRLSAEGELSLSLGNVVGIEDLKIIEASAATLKTENTICVLSLSEDAEDAISFDEDLVFNAQNCSVHANSRAVSAIRSNTRFSKPTAASFCAVGGVSGEVEPHSRGECTPVADPYEAVPAAELGTCEREFLIENAVPGTGANGNTGNEYVSATGQYNDDTILPAVNPVSVDALITELQTKNPSPNYTANDGPIHRRRGIVETLQSLTGHDLREMLQAYDSFGGEYILCENPQAQAACYGYNNPFLGTPPGEGPKRELVAAIFEMSFGDFYAEPENVPDIVTNGIVELINGQFYSRNNFDNELVHVSANLTGGNVVLTPGTYCGGLTVDGLSVRFRPGDYIFKDGPLTFLNQSTAEADNVTFGFKGSGATLNIETGSSLDIRAATSGPRKGLAFMQIVDASAPGNTTEDLSVNRIASGGNISMAGTAYFPKQKLMISGENTRLGASSPAVGLIADSVEFRGQSGSHVELGVDHVRAGIPPIQPRVDDGVRLVE